jgi:hypothetical protein
MWLTREGFDRTLDLVRTCTSAGVKRTPNDGAVASIERHIATEAAAQDSE